MSAQSQPSNSTVLVRAGSVSNHFMCTAVLPATVLCAGFLSLTCAPRLLLLLLLLLSLSLNWAPGWSTDASRREGGTRSCRRGWLRFAWRGDYLTRRCPHVWHSACRQHCAGDRGKTRRRRRRGRREAHCMLRRPTSLAPGALEQETRQEWQPAPVHGRPRLPTEPRK